MAITLRGDQDSDFSNGIDISGTDIELNDDGTCTTSVHRIPYREFHIDYGDTSGY